VLVVKLPLLAYQNTGCFERPIGRIAPRSFLDTDNTRVRESFAVSQSVSVVPRKRNGDAPSPCAPMSGEFGSSTPVRLVEIPVRTGNRPDIVAECPGAVSVIPWS
jgi:hypothetical protein